MQKLNIVLVALFLSACASRPAVPTIDANAIAQTAVAAAWLSTTQTAQAQPTNTPPPSFTPLPAYTPTITNTSAPSATPPPTIDPLYINKIDGFYLVGKNIAPGVWKSNGTGPGCYWSVTTATGDIMNNHFGQAGGTAYIPPEAFQVEFNGCGTWSFLQGP